MSLVVRGLFKDLAAFVRLPRERQARTAAAHPPQRPAGAIQALAQALHPRALALRIVAVRSEGPTTGLATGPLAKTFRLEADREAGTTQLPPFRAGQRLALLIDVDGTPVMRPYSLCSAPAEAVGEGGFYEITVRRKADGFASLTICDRWQVGTRVRATAPDGPFTYEPLRDSPQLIGLAGGCGITPFRSLAKALVAEAPATTLRILYGVRNASEAMFVEELEALGRQSGGRVEVTLVCSEPQADWHGRTGLLTAELIREQMAGLAAPSFFVCGPPAMYRYVLAQLESLAVPRRRIRREVIGEVRATDGGDGAATASAAAPRSHTILLHQGATRRELPARADETVLVALERAGVAPASLCRSGECGFCRAELLRGEIHVPEESDGRRAADKHLGGFHPCASYPRSDLELVVPPSPLL